jgi:hypothetical protein
VKRELDPDQLVARHPGISPGVALSLTEAAAVVLDRHHEPPTRFELIATRHTSLDVEWAVPDEGVLRAWADAALATERAAEAIAILGVEAECGLVVVERAARGSRLDFYLASDRGADLEDAIGLEVAGVDDGALDRLLRRKEAQARANPSRLPAIAAAVRFARPRVTLSFVEPEQP